MRQKIDYSKNLLLNIDHLVSKGLAYKVAAKITESKVSPKRIRTPLSLSTPYSQFLSSLGVDMLGNC